MQHKLVKLIICLLPIYSTYSKRIIETITICSDNYQYTKFEYPHTNSHNKLFKKVIKSLHKISNIVNIYNISCTIWTNSRPLYENVNFYTQWVKKVKLSCHLYNSYK